MYRLIAYRGFESPSLRQDLLREIPTDSEKHPQKPWNIKVLGVLFFLPIPAHTREMGLGPIPTVSLSWVLAFLSKKIPPSPRPPGFLTGDTSQQPLQ